ncbi:MAG: acyl-CoA thioesterase [Clostridiales bacterium]|nr:acyl-CoA thioesterase [Clostridiales bacterium]
MEYAYVRRINYYETDRMGIVHHSNYIRYLEETRCDWMETVGIPMSLLEERGFTIPVLEVTCRYLHPVTSGDVIRIVPKITLYNGVRMTVAYVITDEKTGQPVAEASSGHCFTTLDLHPANMKKKAPDIHAIMEHAAAEA